MFFCGFLKVSIYGFFDEILQNTSENQRKCLIFRKSALWTIVIVKVYKLNTLGQLGNRSEFSSRAILGREGLQHPSAQRVNPIRDVNVFLGNRIFEMFLFQGFQPLIHSYLEIFSRTWVRTQKLFSGRELFSIFDCTVCCWFLG